MKKKMISFLLLTLILTSTLNVTFIIRSTFAQSGENNVLGNNFMEKINETTSPNKDIKPDQSNDLSDKWRNIYERKPDTKQNETLESSSQTSRYGGDRWNFNDTSEWSKFAYIDGNKTRLIVGINSEKPTSLIELEKMAAKHQAEIVNTVSIGGEIRAAVVELLLASVTAFVEEVHAQGLADYIEPNMKVQALLVPNDPYWSLQWGPQKIETDYAWNTTVGDPSVLVAVVDTGIDYTHPDLAANYVPLGYDWVNMDPDPLDDFGHGTHCAGIIAAVLNNAVGIVGIANVSIMAEKGLDAYGSGWDDDLANAIIHAVDQGADILSNSWGGYGESYLIHDAVQYAYNHSVLVIAAAGNEAWSRKSIPAAYDEVVAVTATDSYDAPAWFTNFGDWVEVAAPGVDIYSTMPTYYVTLNDYGYSMNYSYMSGTSMACPHAAGVAALIWSQFPNATRDWVRAQLRYTGDDLGDPGFDEYYGYGRINARKAVEQAPPEHDLLIFDWNRPQYVKLGELATFNITVLNFGVSNETNVEVHLLVNDSLVDLTSISPLPGGTSRTVSLSWTPTTVGTHNVTYYVVPASDETIIQNNQISEILYVITPPSETNWILLATDPDEGVGTNLKSIYGQTYSDTIYFKVECHRPWTTINDIDTAIFIDADQNASTGLPDGTYPGQDTGIGADYVIVVGWEATEMWKWDPIAKWWDLGNPISLAYLDAPEDSDVFVVGVFFADVETTGIIDCAVADIPSNWDWMPDSGHFTWVVIRYEHELAVLLKTPQYLQPEENSLLNATVCNRGLNNETNVEIHLLINGTEVASETLDELVNGTCYTINYSWTPTAEGIYNITAYAPPVPSENFTINNINTKFVSVHYPLINPEPGQYANYVMNYYDSSGHLIGQQGYLNLTYEYYIEPYKIYITAWQKDPAGYIYTGWIIVNTMTRLVESGNIWTGWWYPGWIETDINIGSTINLMDGTATVNDTRMLVVGPRAIECWEIPYSMYGYPYTFWYDKASGLWIGMQYVDLYSLNSMELLLVNTNVPIGTQYEHDLGVTLDAPLRLQPGETSVLNATVYNLGLNNETNVGLQLLINGTIVDFAVIPELLAETSYTLSYLWAPSTGGLNYNVTAYASPVPGENFTLNNRITKMVYVSFYARTYFPPQWVGGGAPMGWHADDYSWSYILPFDFPFYYIYYRTIYISSNGLITFLAPDGSYGNSISALAQKLAIAPAWDDWVTYDPYDIFIWQNSTHIGIRWYVRAYGSNFVANFEAILSSDGVIQFNYGYNDGPVSSTIGISNGAGDILAEDATNINYTNTIVFTPPPYHDVAVTNVTPSKTVVGQGFSLSINVTAANQGNYTETFNITVYANTTAIATQTITLTSGNSTTITFTWNTTGFAKGNYTISAYAWPVPDETDTADNTYIDGTVLVTIPGDVNGDKTVNILDCIVLANHFGHANGNGHTPSTEEWKKCMNCDINGDFKINILDCIILSNHFG